MPTPTPFRLNRSGFLLALISAAFAGQASAAAGRVDFALGGATVAGSDGRERPVARGAELNSGDVVRTNNGRVQVRMSDGAFISLQPNTEFGIKDYKFEGKTDGSESALYSLVKGAMRTVTGLIGRVNRNRYQVATPTATVGIRGTGGLIQVLNDGSTLVQGTSGIWFLANPAGSIDVPAGVAGIAPSDPKEPPKETTQVPAAGPTPPPVQEEYVQGNQRTDGGEPVITVESTTETVSGLAAAVAFTPFTNSGTATSGDPVQVVFSSGQAIDIAFSGSTQKMALQSGGQNVDFGSDGILTWGRWVGTVDIECGECATPQTFNSNQGLHYVVGMPTVNMPASGTATYALAGATQPTFVDGSGSPGTFSFAQGGGLFVNYGATYSVSLSQAQVTMPNWGTYNLNGSTCSSGSSFSMSLFATGTGQACPACSCSSFMTGFFAGTNAERAGIAYHISDGQASPSKQIIGAAALQKLVQ